MQTLRGDASLGSTSGALLRSPRMRCSSTPTTVPASPGITDQSNIMLRRHQHEGSQGCAASPRRASQLCSPPRRTLADGPGPAARCDSVICLLSRKTTYSMITQFASQTFVQATFVASIVTGNQQRSATSGSALPAVHSTWGACSSKHPHERV